MLNSFNFSSFFSFPNIVECIRREFILTDLLTIFYLMKSKCNLCLGNKFLKIINTIRKGCLIICFIIQLNHVPSALK